MKIASTFLVVPLGEADECSWKHVPGAFLGGFAGETEDIFSSPRVAQCECLSLGPACRGITCETGVS